MPADFLGQRPTPRHIAWSERRDNVFRIYIVPNIYGLDIEFRYGRELESRAMRWPRALRTVMQRLAR
jgi:hypothetical protein